MSYLSYDYFTRKQCNAIYSAFKSGKLTPPKDCRGKVKKPSFIYRYENASRFMGMSLTKDERLFNCQLAALGEVIRLIFTDEFAKAQSILDCSEPNFIWKLLPEGVEPKKMWKVV